MTTTISIKSKIASAKNQLATERLIVARVYVALSILFTVLISAFDTTSRLAYAAEFTHAPSWMMYSAIAVCFVSIIDIIINDFLPDKYSLEYAFCYRHVIYMLLALISFSISVGIITTYGSTFQVGRLWLDGCVATVVAFLDILARRGYIGSTIHIQPH